MFRGIFFPWLSCRDIGRGIFSPPPLSITEGKDVQDECLKWRWKDKGGIGVWVFIQLCLRNAVITFVGTALTSGNLRPGMKVSPTEFQRSSWPCLFGFMVSRGIKYVIRYTILFLCLFIVFGQACNFVQSVIKSQRIIQFSSFRPSEGACVCYFSSGICSQLHMTGESNATCTFWHGHPDELLCI